MLQRTRSASLPKDVGDFIFLGETDLHSDVYDDSVDKDDTRSDRRSAPPPQNALQSETEKPLYNSDLLTKMFLVVASGAFSSILFEMLLRVDSDSALLSALLLHVWTVVIAIPHSYQYILSPKIPYYWHFLIVLLSFSFLLLKSFAIKRLPMPLLIVCSNLQLVFGLFVGKGLFNKTFSIGQYLGVVVITTGCIMITLASAKPPTGNDQPSDKSMTDILSGIGFITASITAIAIMIPTGSMLVQRYNADVQEQIFLQHFLALPLFAMQSDRIGPCVARVYHATNTWSLLEYTIPVVPILLVGTTIFAHINRYLTMEVSVTVSPLASQLVNTSSKTIVLLVSMLHFNAPPYPTVFVWLGVVIQTIGSVVYVQSSYSDTNKSNFKPTTTKSRFRRVSWTGSQVLSLSDKDVERLRDLADARRKQERVRRVASDSVMSTLSGYGREMGGVGEGREAGEGEGVSSPLTKTRRPAFSSADFKKMN